MREFKFRGKRTKDGEWVYGFYVREEGLKRDGFHSISHTIITKREPFRSYQDRVYADTVGQYTGIRDNNGVEIYEGDIVRPIKSMFLPGNPVGCVLWQDARFVIRRHDLDEGDKDDWESLSNYLWEDRLHLEVVGNRWDNPELLEVK